ncbi:MAG: lytic murein transglycosylase B [Gammaproteobacteria bacterium]
MTYSSGRRLAVLTLLAAGLLSAPHAHANDPLDLTSPALTEFIERMESKHGVPRDRTVSILKEARIQPRIIEIMSKPAEKVMPWYEYREIFITDKRIDAGIEFWSEHEDTLNRISSKTGVPVEIIVGIIGVETFFGRITGNYRVIDSLATLAFEYPPRSKFFSSELEQFLLLTDEHRIDPLTVTGSYAGAMGGPQFISSSYRAYAVDGSGDERVDLWSDWADIIASVANYFMVHGWIKNGPVLSEVNGPVPADALSKGTRFDREVGVLLDKGVDFKPVDEKSAGAMLFALEYKDGPGYWVGYKNFYVITRYNHSVMYASAVYELATGIRQRREAGVDAG